MVRGAPTFLVIMAGERAGVIAMSVAGQRLVRDYAIGDPALKIARELGDHLTQDYGLRPSAPVLVDDDRTAKQAPLFNGPTQIDQANPAADLVLVVWTSNWNIEPFTSEDPMYRVRYLVNIRLIDAKVDVVIAEGTCRSVSEDESLAPTYDKLLADHARRLKDELDGAAEYCVEDFRSRILSLTPEP
jgi:hypothetical protein